MQRVTKRAPSETELQTHLVLGRILLERLERGGEEIMLLGVCESLVKSLWSSKSEVAQSRVVSSEMVVDAMALDMGIELAQLTEEGEVLARILWRETEVSGRIQGGAKRKEEPFANAERS